MGAIHSITIWNPFNLIRCQCPFCGHVWPILSEPEAQTSHFEL
jgi:hypothetical protein